MTSLQGVRFAGFYPVQVKLDGVAKRDKRYHCEDTKALLAAGSAMAASQTVKETLHASHVAMMQVPEALATAFERGAKPIEVDSIMRGLSDTAPCRFVVAADDKHGSHASLWQHLYESARHQGKSFEMAQWAVFQDLMGRAQLKKAVRRHEPVLVRPGQLKVQSGRQSFTARIGFLNRVFTQEFSMAVPKPGGLGTMITEKAISTPVSPPVSFH